MKLVLINADGERIARYGVSDFETTDVGTVTVFYSITTQNQADAPGEETFTAQISHGAAGNWDDPAYYYEDLEFEQRKADDFADYRLPEDIPESTE